MVDFGHSTSSPISLFLQAANQYIVKTYHFNSPALGEEDVLGRLVSKGRRRLGRFSICRCGNEYDSDKDSETRKGILARGSTAFLNGTIGGLQKLSGTTSDDSSYPGCYVGKSTDQSINQSIVQGLLQA